MTRVEPLIKDSIKRVSKEYSIIIDRDITDEERTKIMENSQYDFYRFLEPRLRHMIEFEIYSKKRTIIIFKLIAQLNDCTRFGYNHWRKLNVPKNIETPTFEQITSLQRYFTIALYIEKNKSIELTNHLMKILLTHVEEIDTDYTIPLTKLINGVSLIELIAQSFLKQDLRLPVEKDLEINTLNVSKPPEYTNNDNDNSIIKKPTTVFVEQAPSAPPCN